MAGKDVLIIFANYDDNELHSIDICFRYETITALADEHEAKNVFEDIVKMYADIHSVLCEKYGDVEGQIIQFGQLQDNAPFYRLLPVTTTDEWKALAQIALDNKTAAVFTHWGNIALDLAIDKTDKGKWQSKLIMSYCSSFDTDEDLIASYSEYSLKDCKVKQDVDIGL